jgi:hypothetical protein
MVKPRHRARHDRLFGSFASEEVAYKRGDLIAMLRAVSECTDSRNRRDAAANSRASESDAPVIPRSQPSSKGRRTSTGDPRALVGDAIGFVRVTRW